MELQDSCDLWYSLVGAGSVETLAVVLTEGGCFSTLVTVDEAAGAFVPRWTVTGVSAAGLGAAPPPVGAGIGQTAVLVFTMWT